MRSLPAPIKSEVLLPLGFSGVSHLINRSADGRLGELPTWSIAGRDGRGRRDLAKYEAFSRFKTLVGTARDIRRAQPEACAAAVRR